MGERLKKQVALVTNGGYGVGRHVCLLLAEEGASIIVNVSNKPMNEVEYPKNDTNEIVEHITSRGGKAVADFSDTSLMKGGEAAVRTALENFGRLDIVINNMVYDKPPSLRCEISNMEPQDFDRAILNVAKSTFTSTRHAAQRFRQQRSGKIVNLVKEIPSEQSGRSEEAASSEAVVGFTRTVARDLGKYGVTCNGITSSRKETGIAGANAQNSFPTPGFFSSEAVLAVYLCTEPAADINGNIFGVCEGDIYIHSNPSVVRSVYKASPPTMDDMDELAPGVLWNTR